VPCQAIVCGCFVSYQTIEAQSLFHSWTKIRAQFIEVGIDQASVCSRAVGSHCNPLIKNAKISQIRSTNDKYCCRYLSIKYLVVLVA
jgi:hypothetical protein